MALFKSTPREELVTDGVTWMSYMKHEERTRKGLSLLLFRDMASSPLPLLNLGSKYRRAISKKIEASRLFGRLSLCLHNTTSTPSKHVLGSPFVLVWDERPSFPTCLHLLLIPRSWALAGCRAEKEPQSAGRLFTHVPERTHHIQSNLHST